MDRWETGFADEVRLYGHLALTSIKSQMQYKLSFFFMAFASLASTLIEIVGIWVLFSRFGNLGEWNLYHVCFFYGVVNLGFSIADALSTGFDQFGRLFVKTGHFDRLLLRPRTLVVQILGHELAVRRVGRLIQALIVLAWAGYHLVDNLHPLAPLILSFAVIGVVCLFLGLFVIQATLSFWTIESLEIMNVVTYGGVETAQYPLPIYSKFLQRFFTCIVPIACVAYFPVVAVLGVTDPLGSSFWFQVCSPFAGCLFLLVAVGLFNAVGVRHYGSTGS